MKEGTVKTKDNYVKPILMEYGSIADMTRTANGNASDNNQPNNNHQAGGGSV